MDTDSLRIATAALVHLNRPRAGEVRPTSNPKGALLILHALEVQCPDAATAQTILDAVTAAQSAALAPLRALHVAAAEAALAPPAAAVPAAAAPTTAPKA